jgi:hypothetical protein
MIGLALLGVAIAVPWLAGFVVGTSQPDTASIGSCVARDGAASISPVKCGDPAATYKVVGKVTGRTHAQFSVNSRQICERFPNAKSAYWKGAPGGIGYVLCLAPVR